MYDSNLTDTEWALITHHYEPQDSRGTEPRHDKRDIINAIVYINKTGAQWRMLPKEYPNWKTVYDHYRRWTQRGVWEAALDELNQRHRKETAKKPRPATAS